VYFVYFAVQKFLRRGFGFISLYGEMTKNGCNEHVSECRLQNAEGSLLPMRTIAQRVGLGTTHVANANPPAWKSRTKSNLRKDKMSRLTPIDEIAS
jgi:hypothetical protein